MNLVDTNVILRYLVSEKKDFPGIGRLFTRMVNNEEKVECPGLVFYQTIFVLKSFYKVSRGKIVQLMEGLIAIPGFYFKNKTLLLLTLDIWKKYGDNIIDAHLAAISISENNRMIYSLDRKMDRLTKFRVVPK